MERNRCHERKRTLCHAGPDGPLHDHPTGDIHDPGDGEPAIRLSDSGTFTLITRAQDSTGRITDSEISIEIAYPAGKVATPFISPSGGFIRTSRSVSITCSTAGATIEYKLGLVGVQSGGGTYVPYTGSFTVYPETRVWARATASGLTDSDYARADFYRDESIYSGNYIEP